MSNMEQTLSIIKPDAVERNLSDEIKDFFLKNNLSIKDKKRSIFQKMKQQNFYKVHNQNHFNNEFCIYHFRTNSSDDFRGKTRF